MKIKMYIKPNQDPREIANKVRTLIEQNLRRQCDVIKIVGSRAQDTQQLQNKNMINTGDIRSKIDMSKVSRIKKL